MGTGPCAHSKRQTAGSSSTRGPGRQTDGREGQSEDGAAAAKPRPQFCITVRASQFLLASLGGWSPGVGGFEKMTPAAPRPAWLLGWACLWVRTPPSEASTQLGPTAAAAAGWGLALAAFRGRDPGEQSPRSREKADGQQWPPAGDGAHSLGGAGAVVGNAGLFGLFLVKLRQVYSFCF